MKYLIVTEETSPRRYLIEAENDEEVKGYIAEVVGTADEYGLGADYYELEEGDSHV